MGSVSILVIDTFNIELVHYQILIFNITYE